MQTVDGIALWFINESPSHQWMLAVEPKTHRRPVKSPKRVSLQFKPTSAASGKVKQTAGPEKKTFRSRRHRTQAGNSRARGKRPTPPHKARILPTSPAENSRRMMMLTKRLSTKESCDPHAVVEVLETKHQGTELADVQLNTGIQQVKWTKIPPRNKGSPQLNRDISWRPEQLKKKLSAIGIGEQHMAVAVQKDRSQRRNCQQWKPQSER
jgi:hypothetical protein